MLKRVICKATHGNIEFMVLDSSTEGMDLCHLSFDVMPDGCRNNCVLLIASVV